MFQFLRGRNNQRRNRRQCRHIRRRRPPRLRGSYHPRTLKKSKIFVGRSPPFKDFVSLQEEPEKKQLKYVYLSTDIVMVILKGKAINSLINLIISK